ncbi:menaquinol-cytochrome c reductase cytochrome c1 subunit precursor [Actinopolymorpha singaporensis]|uniref:Cytochrome bc1 complex cytochrome c subunit n=1 Tax=Actinopolymorpha singaporensis TaxID=117157 RepID=A0A1H1XCR7_9ACTN|nr:menaquinol-cytochrome c reductase cytochrome c1 subunit precursor [Actinopolymorpha singaporensis]
MPFGVRGRPRFHTVGFRARPRLSTILSARRRNRFAGLVVVALALTVFGGVYAVASPSSKASADAAQSTQVEQGRKLFAVSCSSCHGLNAQGTNAGPPLIGVGAAAVDFQVGTGRMPAQQPGAQIPKKPVAFNDQEIAALAAYVASLGPGPSVPSKQELDTSDLSDAEIAQGGELFRTNCASCHNVAGKGGALTWGKYAPNIDNTTDRHIYEAMLTGPQNMPVFSDQVITPKNKRQIIAYLDELKQQPSRGGFGLGGLGPVSEGVAAWLAGLGACIVLAVWIAAKTARTNGKGAQGK